MIRGGYGNTKFDLHLLMTESATGYAAWDYNRDLFDPATIIRMINHFEDLLQAIVANPDQRIVNLPLLKPKNADCGGME